MASVKETVDNVLGTINSALTILDKIPKLEEGDGNLQFGLSLSPFALLAEVLKNCNGMNKFIDIISEFIVLGIPPLEIATKTLIMGSLKNLLTCSLNPMIPNELLKYGMVFDLKEIDIFNILYTSPLDTKQGRNYYFGCEDATIPDDLRYAADFNALLWYMVNRSNSREIWTKCGSGVDNIVGSGWGHKVPLKSPECVDIVGDNLTSNIATWKLKKIIQNKDNIYKNVLDIFYSEDNQEGYLYGWKGNDTQEEDLKYYIYFDDKLPIPTTTINNTTYTDRVIEVPFDEKVKIIYNKDEDNEIKYKIELFDDSVIYKFNTTQKTYKGVTYNCLKFDALTGELSVNRNGFFVKETIKLGTPSGDKNPDKLKKRTGIITLEYHENSQSVTDAEGQPLENSHVPDRNCLHVFIGNTQPKNIGDIIEIRKNIRTYETEIKTLQDENNSLREEIKTIEKNYKKKEKDKKKVEDAFKDAVVMMMATYESLVASGESAEFDVLKGVYDFYVAEYTELISASGAEE